MKKILLAVSLLLALDGCRSNPYPDQGQILQNKPNKPPAAFSIDTIDTVEFQEGTPGSFSVKGYVPSGQPLITFDGLPKDGLNGGATYDAVNSVVNWTPNYTAANDPNDASIILKTYSVTITLKDPKDSLTVAQKTVTLIVHDTLRNFGLVNFQASSNLTEGLAFTQDITINEDDFPQGPFGIRTDGLPLGATISLNKAQPTVFHLKFTPDFGFVTVNDGSSKYVDWTLYIYDPRGRELTQQVHWVVNSNRQGPKVFIPTNINQGPPSVDFMLNATDLNGEVPPKVTVDSPISGTIVLEDAGSSPGTPSSKPLQAINVKWTQIASTEAGKHETLTFHSCVNDSNGGQNLCTTTSVPVYLNGGRP